MHGSCGKFFSLFALLITLLVSGGLQAQSRTFRIVGYVPNWIDVAVFSLNFDFRQVTHLNYAFQNPDVTGNLIESNSGLDKLVEKAHANNVKVLVSLGGASSAGGSLKMYYQSLISSSEKRASFIHKIVVYINKYKLDGLDVDIEGPTINSDYGPFIRQLVDSLKPNAKLLTAAVGWGAENIQNLTLQFFDWVNLMAYDYTGNWDLSHPGQHSPYWYSQKMISDYLKRGMKKENICLGVPFYGYGFYKMTGSFNYNDILAKFPNAWQSDQVGDTIYYNGMPTIYKKTKLAMAEASGIMIWELSNDVKGERSLLKVISSTVDSLGMSVIAKLSESANLNIYPNPASEYILVKIRPGGVKIAVEVFDIQGCLVISKVVYSSESQVNRIDISSLSRGEYICRVTSPEGVCSKGFLKE